MAAGPALLSAPPAPGSEGEAVDDVCLGFRRALHTASRSEMFSWGNSQLLAWLGVFLAG